MRSIISMGFMLLVGLVPFNHLNASEVAVARSAVVEKSVPAILDILRDHTNTCHSGCLYKMTNLEESQVIDVNEIEEIVWQRISGIRETRQFVKSSLSKEGDVFVWFSRYPEQSELDNLQIETGLDHVSTFRVMQIKWQLKPISESQTEVSVEMKVDHTLSAVGDPIIRNSINKTLLTLFYNFSI